MTTLYLCRGCTILLGALVDPETECENCGHPGPHIGGEFDDADASLLILGGEHGDPTT